MKKKINIICAVLTAIIILLGVYAHFKDTGEIDAENITKAITTITESIATKDLVVEEYAIAEAEDTREVTQQGESVATTGDIEEVDETTLEEDGTVDQEDIAYNGDITGNGLSLLGAYQGLTYYSQADSRWANVMYSSTGNATQTMKSSACGPTSMAIVVSSSKGAILPTTMASLAVSNGYRTANNGTAWSYYSFCADYFGFKDYHSTSDFNTAIDYLKQGYFAVASCGFGLFTTQRTLYCISG